MGCVLGGEEIEADLGLIQPLHHSLDDRTPDLRGEARPAFQDQTLQDQRTLTVLILSHGAAIVLQCGYRGQCHLDDGLYCCWVTVEDFATIVNEQL